MTTTTNETPAKGFSMDLGGGVELIASHIPGKKDAYLGLKKDATFVALAKFISDDDMTFLHDVLASRLITAFPLPGAERVI